MKKSERDALTLVTPPEIAELFGVMPKTVTKWALNGQIPSIKIPGGHYRFTKAMARDILAMRDNLL
jgi:excisionase family DNA binding protein